MRVFVPITLVLIGAAIFTASPADATNYSQAVKLCKKNPKCEQHGHDFCVNSCHQVVTCDPGKYGKCWVVHIQSDGGKKHVQGNVGAVLTVTGKPHPTRRPSAGLLDANPGFSQQGPAATGTPTAPPPPPSVLK